MTTLPIAVGFGISTPEQAAAIVPLADGIVVGSALVRLIAEKRRSDAVVRAVAALAAKIRRAIDTPALRGRHLTQG
jgi:tryptophan synthase alpha chain